MIQLQPVPSHSPLQKRESTGASFFSFFHYDQILDIRFFTFSYTIGVSQISCQISISYEHYNERFWDFHFREFSAAINFPCSNSLLRIELNDIIFSKILQNYNNNQYSNPHKEEHELWPFIIQHAKLVCSCEQISWIFIYRECVIEVCEAERNRRGKSS